LGVHLIKAEMKNFKIGRELEKVGFDPSYFMQDVGSIVLRLAGFTDRTDNIYDWYYGLLEQYSKEVDYGGDEKNFTEVATRFFAELKSNSLGQAPTT
jgi:hypothetical protein